MESKATSEEMEQEAGAPSLQTRRMESIGVLAGGIAHDINNILSIIVANIDLVLDAMPKHDPARDKLQTAVDACFRARDVAAQLIAFSRLKEKQRFPLKINFLVNESLRMLRAVAPGNIQIIHNVRYDASKILSDPAQINQLVINLCMNSIHAMEDKGGILDVGLMNVEFDDQAASDHHVKKGGRYVCLTVKDTGGGIDPALQERIFEPYFTTKKMGKGSGLGLAVVHGIVEEYGGGIKIDSLPGRGTTVHVFFPISEDEPETASQKEIFDPQKTGAVLLVDDEELIVEVASLLLEKLGYEVTSTTSPVEALEIFKSSPARIGLVITDAMMPKMRGEDLIKNILSIRPNMPTIMCTGSSGVISESEAREIGASSFLKKPFKKLDMVRAIQEALAK